MFSSWECDVGFPCALPTMARAATHLSGERGVVLARHRLDGWSDSVGAHVDLRPADRQGEALKRVPGEVAPAV